MEDWLPWIWSIVCPEETLALEIGLGIDCHYYGECLSNRVALWQQRGSAPALEVDCHSFEVLQQSGGTHVTKQKVKGESNWKSTIFIQKYLVKESLEIRVLGQDQSRLS